MFTWADFIYATYKLNTEHVPLEKFKFNLKSFSKQYYIYVNICIFLMEISKMQIICFSY